MSEKKKKFNFIIKIKQNQLDIIDKKYGIIVSSNLHENNDPINNNITDLKELNYEEINKNFSFYDESKKLHQSQFTMINHLNNNILPDKTDIKCYWCRNNFNYIPIGCPINYIPSKLIKKYYSEITKDKYIMRENISNNKIKDIKKNIDIFGKNKKLKISENNIYETDGIFCSFNCCLAYIKDNKHLPLYNKSENLLSQMFFKLFEDPNLKIIPAPPWKLLSEYGGNLSIHEFREKFNKVDYQNINNYINKVPRLFPIGMLYEVNIKF